MDWLKLRKLLENYLHLAIGDFKHLGAFLSNEYSGSQSDVMPVHTSILYENAHTHIYIYMCGVWSKLCLILYICHLQTAILREFKILI